MVAYRGEPGFLSPYYAGIRNFHLPALLLAWAVLITLDWRSRIARNAALLMLTWWALQAVLFIGPKRFRDEPARLETAPLLRQEPLEVPIDPPGWTMRLEPREPAR